MIEQYLSLNSLVKCSSASTSSLTDSGTLIQKTSWLNQHTMLLFICKKPLMVDSYILKGVGLPLLLGMSSLSNMSSSIEFMSSSSSLISISVTTS